MALRLAALLRPALNCGRGCSLSMISGWRPKAATCYPVTAGLTQRFTFTIYDKIKGKLYFQKNEFPLSAQK